MMGTIRPTSGARPWLAALALAVGIASLTPTQAAELTGEFIVFPTVSKTLIFTDRVTDDVDLQFQHPEIDFFATADYGPLRFLGEYQVVNEGYHHSHITRLQLGWSPKPDLTLWAGRFHNPLGYWNTQYHHGSYLETSAARPSFLQYEDSDGVLPLHLVGLYLEGWQPMTSGTLHYTAAAGENAIFTSGRLRPLELFENNIDAHQPGVTLRLDWLPDRPNLPLLGAFASHMSVAIDPNTTNGEADLTVAGVFGDWSHGAGRVLGALFGVRDEINATDSTFTYGYVQGELMWAPRLTAYARLEGSNGTNDDPYLANFSNVSEGDRIAGLRVDFMENQALKIEYARVHQINRHFDEITFQWSASYP